MAAGLVVLPAVGVVRGIQLTAAAHLAIAVAAASAAPGVRALRVSLRSAAAALAVLVVTGDAAPFAGRVAEGWRLLLTDEEPQDTTTVVERPLGRGRTRGIRLSVIERVEEVPALALFESAGQIQAQIGDDIFPVHAAKLPEGHGTLKLLRLNDGQMVLCYPIEEVVDIVRLPDSSERRLTCYESF